MACHLSLQQVMKYAASTPGSHMKSWHHCMWPSITAGQDKTTVVADLPHDCERSDTPHNHLLQAVSPALQLL